MKRISLLLLLLLLLNVTAAYAIEGVTYNNLRIVPTSPNASSLGTFGLIPTNNYVGQANLSIPIYEIDLDGKKFPITLSYHTDGTRVAQEATWVGLGWTLQAGGCIVRQVQGLDDFMGRGSYYMDTAPWINTPDFDVDENNTEMLINCAKGDYDAEPDIFYFNAGGHSGSMFFNALKNKRQDLAVPSIQAQEKMVKMVYDTRKEVWTMTDLEGYTYIFSTKETTYSFSKGTDSYLTHFSKNDLPPYEKEPEVTTAWMLNSITSPNGNKIVFNYKKEMIYTPVMTTEDAIFLTDKVLAEMPTMTLGAFYKSYNYNYSCSKIEQCVLESISFEGGKMEFTTTNREDIESAESGKKVQKLSGIKITNTAGTVIKATALEYKYLLSSTETTTNGYNDRLLLAKVYDVAGTKKINEYSLTYNMGQLPPKGSPSIDAWGFYNGASPASSDMPLRITPNIYWSRSIYFDDQLHLFREGMDRSFNEALCKIGTLQTITYPTGGSSSFEYEGHRFEEVPIPPRLSERSLVIVDNSMEPTAINPDIIVYKSEPFQIDDNTQQVILRKYHDEPHPSEYLPKPVIYSTWVEKKEGDTFSILFASPDTDVKDKWLDDTELELGEGTYRIGMKVTNWTFEYPIPISAEVVGKYLIPTDKDYQGAGLRVKSIVNTDGNGNCNWRKFEHLGARLMIKPRFNAVALVMQGGSWAGNWMNAYYQLSQSTPHIPLTSMLRSNLVGYTAVRESYGDQETQGCISYIYHNIPDEIPNLYLAGTPTVPDVENGKINTICYYNKDNKLQKREEFTYMVENCEEIWAPKIKTYYFDSDVARPTRSMAPYKLTAQSIYLSKKVTTEYHPEGNIVDEERYEYTNYGMLASLKSNKHGVEKETKFKYADSYSDAVSNTMKSKHMVGVQIEQIDISGGKVINAMKTEFKDTLGMILPKRTFKLSAAPRTLSDYAGAYTQDIWFDKYTAKGRLLGYIRNNQPVSFLWAYNHLYPVAKIEGKTYGALEKPFAFFINQLPENTDEASISTFLNLIRNTLNNDNALITTYLYRPLVGVTEIMEPNGEKKTFEYDEFQRLLQAKDHNGKVVNKNEYNYKH